MDYLYALQLLRESVPDFVNYVFLFFSEVFLMLAPVLAGIIYWSLSKEDGACIFLGYCTSISVNQFFKNIFCIYRPWILDERLHIHKFAAKSATGYSFPSGHTATATSILGGIAIYQKKRKWLVALLAVLVLIVAFSRNWLGAHTLKDVLVAILLSCAVLCIVNVVRHFLEKKPSLDLWILVVVTVLSVAALIFLSLKSYPIDFMDDGITILVEPDKMLTDCFTATGTTIGAILGWWLERHFVKFQTNVDKKTKIIRSVVGLAIFGLLLLVLSPALKFLGEHIQHIVKYFILTFFAMFVYPLIFSSIEKALKNRESREKN